MSNLCALYGRIASELRVLSPTRYEHPLLGAVALPGREVWPVDADGEESVQRIARGLSRFIYLHYYLDNAPEVERLRRGDPDDFTPIVMREDPEFGRQLRRANTGCGYASGGWTVLSLDTEAIVVVKDSIRLHARRDEVFSIEKPLQPGAGVQVRFPNDLPFANPGYYTVVGDSGLSDSRHGALVRLYFNVLPDSAAALVTTLTRALNQLRIRFTSKFLNHPAAYTRPDAAVLYLQRDDYRRVGGALAALATDPTIALRDPVPAFAKRLSTGVALAEEPQLALSRRLSFGQHRSLIVGCGLARAFLDGSSTAAGRRSSILRAFRKEGLDPWAPYLNAGATDIYETLAPEAAGRERAAVGRT